MERFRRKRAGVLFRSRMMDGANDGIGKSRDGVVATGIMRNGGGEKCRLRRDEEKDGGEGEGGCG